MKSFGKPSRRSAEGSSMNRTSSLMFRSKSVPIAVISSFNVFIRARVASSLSTPARRKSRRTLNTAWRVSASAVRAFNASNASYRSRSRFSSVKKLIAAWYARLPASRPAASGCTLNTSSPCAATSATDRRSSLWGTSVFAIVRFPFEDKIRLRRALPASIPAFPRRSTSPAERANASFGFVMRAPAAALPFRFAMASTRCREADGGYLDFPTARTRRGVRLNRVPEMINRMTKSSGAKHSLASHLDAGAAVHAEHRLGGDRLLALRALDPRRRGGRARHGDGGRWRGRRELRGRGGRRRGRGHHRHRIRGPRRHRRVDLVQSLGQAVGCPEVHGQEEDVAHDSESWREERPPDEDLGELGDLGTREGPLGLEEGDEPEGHEPDDADPHDAEARDQDAREVRPESKLRRLEGADHVAVHLSLARDPGGPEDRHQEGGGGGEEDRAQADDHAECREDDV